MRTEPHRLVFIDETGTNTKMTRARGRCERGERLRSKAPFGHWKTQTFVARLRCGALTAPWVIDAPKDRTIFETYVRAQLVPTLQEGDIVILDNLPAHKSQAAEQAIRERRPPMFLPPYSPDLNPIEMAFAELKAHLRAMAMRTIDELWKAIGQISSDAPSAHREGFGWANVVGGLTEVRVRGLDKVRAAFAFAMGAYDIVRLSKLLAPKGEVRRPTSKAREQ